MNERIRELADRACEYADYDPGYMPDEFLMKFAELIVRECAGMVASSSLPDRYSEPCLIDIANEIKEHFGVEK